jgi:hypothetical protein
VEDEETEITKRQDELYRNEYELLRSAKARHQEGKALALKGKLVELQLQEEASGLKRQKAEREEEYNLKIENENKKVVRLKNDIKFQSDEIGKFELKYNEEMNTRRNPLTTNLNESQKRKAKLEDEIKEL